MDAVSAVILRPAELVMRVADHAGWAAALAAIDRRSPLVGIALAAAGDARRWHARPRRQAGDTFDVTLAAPSPQRFFHAPALTAADVFAALGKVLAAPGRATVAVDAPEVLRRLPLGRLEFDTALARRLLGDAPSDASAGETSAAALARGALRDRHTLAERLHARGLGRLYKEVELPLVPVLKAIEDAGLAVDRLAIGEAKRRNDSQRRALEQEIHRLAGRPFRIDDAKALGEVLFGVLGLPALKRTRAQERGGHHSVGALALGELARAHPLPRAVLELQRLQRLDKDCLAPLARLSDARLRSRYAALQAATGRIAGDGPLPSWHEQRRALGEAAGLDGIFPDAGLVTIDLAQLDLRAAAHLSEDEPLLAACADVDPHRALAAAALGIAPAEVLPAQRAVAKHLALGLLYGASAGRLAADAAISVAEAKALLAERRTRHQRLLAWQSTLVDDARRQGHALSLLGRQKALPELADERPAIQRLGEALAVSAAIAGTAADLAKLAIVRLHHGLAAVAGRIVALIGDAVVVEGGDAAAIAAAADRTLAELGAELGLRVPLCAVTRPGIA
ncbi:MAG: DNA polymerase [Myxococcota bacterium]